MYHSNRTPEGLARSRCKLAFGVAPALVLDEAAWARVQAQKNARWDLKQAETAYAAACRGLSEANRRMGRCSAGVGVSPLYQRRVWVAAAFRAIIRAGARIRAARKVLAALDAV